MKVQKLSFCYAEVPPNLANAGSKVVHGERSMLPYYEINSTPFVVEKGRRYVFFDNADNEYYFSCGDEPEINYVHIVFSPNCFIRGDLMREMSSEKFRDWLLKHQAYDEEMQVVSMMVRILPS